MLVKNKNNVKGKAYARGEYLLFESEENFFSALGVVVIWLNPGSSSSVGDVHGENKAFVKGRGREGGRVCCAAGGPLLKAIKGLEDQRVRLATNCCRIYLIFRGQ